MKKWILQNQKSIHLLMIKEVHLQARKNIINRRKKVDREVKVKKEIRIQIIKKRGLNNHQ